MSLQENLDALNEFVAEYVGTQQDPRLQGAPYRSCFIPLAER